MWGAARKNEGLLKLEEKVNEEEECEWMVMKLKKERKGKEVRKEEVRDEEMSERRSAGR